MKKTILFTLFGIAAFSANAAPEKFMSADTDKDGALSTEEARKALPDVAIVDMNSDGMVNKAEVENVVPGLSFSGDKAEKETSLIGESEYQMIVSVLSERGTRDS